MFDFDTVFAAAAGFAALVVLGVAAAIHIGDFLFSVLL